MFCPVLVDREAMVELEKASLTVDVSRYSNNMFSIQDDKLTNLVLTADNEIVMDHSGASAKGVCKHRIGTCRLNFITFTFSPVYI